MILDILNCSIYHYGKKKCRLLSLTKQFYQLYFDNISRNFNLSTPNIASLST